MYVLPAITPGSFTVVCAQHAAREQITSVIAELALRGSLTVLDGGNRFQAYRVANLIRRQTPDIRAAADRLFIQRAFTCYQMLALLESTPARPQPHLILDLLATFYDDHVPTCEISRLLDACLTQLERLRRTVPVAITLAPPLLEERAFLVERVRAQADTLFTLELPASQPYQPELL
jgi:hypothetical protein